MSSDEGGRPPADELSADEPLDDTDFRLLDGIRDMFAVADPMPADLPERIRFRLALRDLRSRWPGLPRRSRSWPASAGRS